MKKRRRPPYAWVELTTREQEALRRHCRERWVSISAFVRGLIRKAVFGGR